MRPGLHSNVAIEISVLRSCICFMSFVQFFTQHYARVISLLTRPTLDPDFASSFGPISNLQFIFLLIENVAKGFTSFANSYNFHYQFVSVSAVSLSRPSIRQGGLVIGAYWFGWTPRTKVMISVLVLLNLSSALDTVDHQKHHRFSTVVSMCKVFTSSSPELLSNSLATTTAWHTAYIASSDRPWCRSVCGAESELTLQKQRQYAVQLKTFGWWWLPAPLLTRLVQYHRLHEAVSAKPVYCLATQRQSQQIFTCSNLSYSPQPTFHFSSWAISTE